MTYEQAQAALQKLSPKEREVILQLAQALNERGQESNEGHGRSDGRSDCGNQDRKA
jgi:hypothetical protein